MNLLARGADPAGGPSHEGAGRKSSLDKVNATVAEFWPEVWETTYHAESFEICLPNEVAPLGAPSSLTRHSASHRARIRPGELARCGTPAHGTDGCLCYVCPHRYRSAIDCAGGRRNEAPVRRPASAISDRRPYGDDRRQEGCGRESPRSWSPHHGHYGLECALFATGNVDPVLRRRAISIKTPTSAESR